jgi:alpha-galactosidase
MVNFINVLRAEFEATNAPFVIATIGFNGGPYDPDSAYGKIHAAQMAVSDPTKHPEFAGNVMTMDTLDYWRSVEESPVNQGYHYNRNAETFMLVGDAMGRAIM